MFKERMAMRGEMERKTIRLEEAVPRELEISKKKHLKFYLFFGILCSGRFITSSARRSSALDSEGGGGTGDPYGGGGGMEMVSKDNWRKCSKGSSNSSCKSNRSGSSNNKNSNSSDFVSNSKTNNEFFHDCYKLPQSDW